MASPIENFSIRKTGVGLMNLQFDYAGVVESFTHVMVLLVEQDDIPDSWSLKHRNTRIRTDAGWMNFLILDFFNDTYNKWWDEGGSEGSQDDTGNRRRIRRLPLPLGLNLVSFGILFNPNQPDENRTATIPGLEFYAVAGVVATVEGYPVVQLGDLAYSNQLAGV